ncbi:Hypothetical protein R9X50_00138300 [Acrodontium crateriforme]|uniref:Gfd2/YDR514C-like C-terminal domain-containing protein n=1 Tax=Acrodontium crateriforme TaxID=150365 RepID=A0AAQ3R7V0_9PEZI|nr:Hypothetical protein R9X50_00138300 [Acrodontium crateriforme]
MTDSGLSRLDRLKAAIGTENMPPKLPQYTPTERSHKKTLISHLPTIEQHFTTSPNLAKSTNPPTSSVKKSSPPVAMASCNHVEPDTSFHPRCGELAPRGIFFIPFIAVTKFCYTYVRHEHQQDVASALFDAGKIWMRKWDLFFIWNEHCPTGVPMIFICDTQFQVLINDINNAVPHANVWSVEKLGERHNGLVLDFDDIPDRYRPRYLGQSTSKDQYSHWANFLDSSHAVNDGAAEFPGYESYYQMLEAAHQVNRGKGKNKRGGRRSGEPKLTGGCGMGDLKRAQRMLGLAPSDEGTIEASFNNLSISKFSSANPPPFPFEQDVVIIAFDCEAHERYSKAITEVGVAILDTRDLHNLPPGLNGQNWQEKIRARHFRVEEFKNHTNNEFVRGCPTKFDFGESEFVPTGDLPSILTSCFRPPYSNKKFNPQNDDANPRNLILMGHDVTQDIHYTRSIGFDPMNRANISKIPLDTADLFRAYTHSSNKTSLGNMLREFDLVGWNLHNAGNDAVYTVWAFLAICVAHTVKAWGGDVAFSLRG